MKKSYEVEIIRSGQPRAYADTINEYLITVSAEKFGKQGMHPWLPMGDVEAQIEREEAQRAAGTMFGGASPEQLRKMQRDQAKQIVRGLCQKFREEDDDDGRTGMDAAFYPTLTQLSLDAKAGTIRAVILERYTD